MYIDTMREILSANNKIMMDYRGGGNLLMLPLDKLMQQAGTAAQPGVQAAPPAGETSPAPEASPRSRESLRNRDRTDR